MARKSEVKPIELTPDQNTILFQWYEQQTLLARIKELEFTLRQQNAMLGNPEQLEGTENLSIGNGYVLKIKRIQNYTATNKTGETERFLKALATVNETAPVGLIEWKPDLSISTYKNVVTPLLEAKYDDGTFLYPELRKAAADAISIKPGAPQLEIVEPK